MSQKQNGKSTKPAPLKSIVVMKINPIDSPLKYTVQWVVVYEDKIYEISKSVNTIDLKPTRWEVRDQSYILTDAWIMPRLVDGGGKAIESSGLIITNISKEVTEKQIVDKFKEVESAFTVAPQPTVP